MKKLGIIIATIVAISSVNAGVEHWQSEVSAGTRASHSRFEATNSAICIDVGPLNGAMSFEFIVNSGPAGISQTLLGGGSSVGGNTQGLKFEQYYDKGCWGISTMGVEDWNSNVPNITGRSTHVVFTTNGQNSRIYVDGELIVTNEALAIRITGQTGLGGWSRVGGVLDDTLDGSILGFASYNSELSAEEIRVHSKAFASTDEFKPEASTKVLLEVGGVAIGLKSRK